MKIRVGGWANFNGYSSLLSKPLKWTNVTKHESWHADEVRCVPFDHLVFENGRAQFVGSSENQATGGVRIRSKTPYMTLHGEYRLEVELGADELLLLAAEATKNWPMSYLLDRLTSVRNVQEIESNG